MPTSPRKHLRASDLRAVAQLATLATQGVAHMTEGVHQAVRGTLGAGAPGRGKADGITGMVYRAVQGVTALVGKGWAGALTRLEPILESLLDAPAETPEREAVLAALNGVMGDRLLQSGNPLATPMTLRYQGSALAGPNWPDPSEVTGKVLILVHGLSMNDLQWSWQLGGQVCNHGAALASSLGYTPVYLRYNTGLHISQNGQTLAQALEELVRRWPRPIEYLSVLAHSMGGLVTRSAVAHAQARALDWPGKLRHICFLGTPHHGSPLERAGNWVDVLLGSTPYSAPFHRLTQLRSAGITDLRYGFVSEADWMGKSRFRRSPDQRKPVPLPDGVACFAIAATLAGRRSLLADRLVGDGLVPLRSALGQHDQAERCLHFAPAHQWIAYRTNHMQLLHSQAIYEQLLYWLAQPPKSP